MTAKRQTNHVISPLQAFVFAVVLTFGLILVLAPVLPGDAPLNAGDVAYKTFEANGKVIAEKGHVVTESDLATIRSEGFLGNELSFGGVFAAVLAAVVGAGALALYLYLFQPPQVHGAPRLFMVGMLVLFWVAAAKIFLSLTLPDSDRLYLGYILPVAAAPMLIATLLDGGLAVAIAGLIAVLAAFAGFAMPDARAPLASQPLDPLQMVFAYLFAGVAGVFAVRRAERVNAYAMAGVAVGLVTFAALFTFWLLNPDRQGVDLGWMLVASALGGFGSAVVTVGATVVLGLMFGVTTRIQLMELAQLSHPLLRQLQEKAPGTFHHSVIVGNLGERAADLVGADPLLVRVGCYFHDIGKVAHPGYYIENQQDAANPHDRLDPAASARLVADHVKAGMELTAKYRVPAVVRAFVPEHHGTRLITYFYRKASAADPTVDPEKFRYPGPRPQSRETAIVMLSDSVEAVVRSSKDRSFERIDELVDSVINERVTEGQLDDCNLTLRDIKVIGESFKATLRG
ncbi:MAG TPA: HDIG domain-containing protein, partial [Dehalococcoidia bacterium]|nr:HDIG domain-containing protein [Dehalococcoidia bacterium]